MACYFASNKRVSLTSLDEPAADSATWAATWSNIIGGNGAMYGYSVSLSGGTMAVGSPSDNFEYLNDQGMSLYSNQFRFCFQEQQPNTVCILQAQSFAIYEMMMDHGVAWIKREVVCGAGATAT